MWDKEYIQFGVCSILFSNCTDYLKSELKLPDISECEVAVLGLGYVGLPLAVGISRCKICNLTNNILNRKVIGFDISIDRVNELSRGFDRTKELSDTNLNESGIFFTNNFDDLKKSDVFIVTVPTPIDEMKVPDLVFAQWNDDPQDDWPE